MISYILPIILVVLSITAFGVLLFGLKQKRKSILCYKNSCISIVLLNVTLVISTFSLPRSLSLSIEKVIPILTLLIFRNLYIEFYRSIDKEEKNSLKFILIHAIPYVFSFLMVIDLLRVFVNQEMTVPSIDVYHQLIVVLIVGYQLIVLMDLFIVNWLYAKASLERYRQVYIANVFVGLIYIVLTITVFTLGQIESNILVSGVLYTLYVSFLVVNHVRSEWLPHAQTEKLIIEEKMKKVDRPVKTEDRRALDSLTGVFTREYFLRYIKTLDTNDDALTIVLMNVTGLKLINESFGYDTGDEILQEIAVNLNESFQSATIGRMSGSLFVVLLSGFSEDQINKKILVVKNACMDREGFVVNLYFGHYMRKAKDLSPFDVYKRAEEELYYNKVIVNQKHQSHISDMLYKNFGMLLPNLSDHLRRSADLSKSFGQYLHLSEDMISDLYNATILHDIALTIMPTIVEYNVAFKDAFEKRVYKSHVSKGYDIAIESGINARTAKAIMHHHENYNGSGYPHGLANEDIPELSQVIAIVDLVDMIMHYGKKANELEMILISKINVVFSEELIYTMIAFLKENKIIEESS